MQHSRLLTATMICSLSFIFGSSVHADMSSAPKQADAKIRLAHEFLPRPKPKPKPWGNRLVIHFYADWCGPCQQMERSVLNQPGVLRRLGADVVGVKVNADHHPSIRSRFGVSGFPTDVMVSPDGKVDTRYVGATSESSYISRLEQLAAKYPGKPAAANRPKPLKSRLLKDGPGKRGQAASQASGIGRLQPRGPDHRQTLEKRPPGI